MERDGAEILASRDPAELSQMASESLGWKVKLRCERSFSGAIAAAPGHLFNAIRGKFETMVTASALEPPANLSFILMTKGAVSPSGRNGAVFGGSDQVIALKTAEVTQMKLFGPIDAVHLTVPCSEVTRLAQRFLGPEATVQINSLEAIATSNPEGRFVQKTLRILYKAILLRNGKELSDFALTSAEHSALATLLSFFSGARDCTGEEHSMQPRIIVKRATELLASMKAPVQVLELAGLLGISIRYLQLCFMRELGISPHAFFKHWRLEAVKRETCAAGQGSLGAIGRHWGFSNITRLRQEYVRAFGKDEWLLMTGMRSDDGRNGDVFT